MFSPLSVCLRRGASKARRAALRAVLAASLAAIPSPVPAQEAAPAEANAPGLAAKFKDVTALGGVIKTRYYEAGSGEPMVLVHGGGWAGYYSANTWSTNIPGLAKRFHVFAADKLAAGMTGNPPNDANYNIQGEVEHMYQFIRSLNLGPVHLVGQSRGAGLALLLTVAHPEIVKTLVLVDSLTISPDVGNSDMHEKLMAKCPGDRDESWKCEMRVLSFDGERAFPDDSFPPGLYMGHLPKSVETMRKVKAGAGEPLVSQFPAYKQQILDRLKREHVLDMPILLYWAVNDPQAPALLNGVAVYEILRAKHPQARMLIVNDAGHFHYREYPEEFNHNVSNFIDFWSGRPGTGGAPSSR
ncbi:MAG: alpha/beta fold hydrolase [Vicinamibacterales bacterium]